MRAIVAAALVAISLAPVVGQAPAAPANIAGPWTITLDMVLGTASPRIAVVQDGEKISGTYTSGRYGDFPFTGTVKGRAVTITVRIEVERQPLEIVFTGDVASNGRAMEGRASLGALGDGTWRAAREPAGS